MAELKKVARRVVRVVCDCGDVHELTADKEGNLTLETFVGKNKAKPAPTEKAKSKGGGSIFDPEEEEPGEVD